MDGSSLVCLSFITLWLCDMFLSFALPLPFFPLSPLHPSPSSSPSPPSLLPFLHFLPTFLPFSTHPLPPFASLFSIHFPPHTPRPPSLPCSVPSLSHPPPSTLPLFPPSLPPSLPPSSLLPSLHSPTFPSLPPPSFPPSSLLPSLLPPSLPSPTLLPSISHPLPASLPPFLPLSRARVSPCRLTWKLDESLPLPLPVLTPQKGSWTQVSVCFIFISQEKICYRAGTDLFASSPSGLTL